MALAVVSVSAGFAVAIARSDIAFAEQTVNRAGKSDRLVRAFNRQAINQVPDIKASRTLVLDSKLADGCESLVSPLANPLFARIASRCVS